MHLIKSLPIIFGTYVYVALIFVKASMDLHKVLIEAGESNRKTTNAMAGISIWLYQHLSDSFNPFHPTHATAY